MRYGDQPDNFYIILSGRVAVEGLATMTKVLDGMSPEKN